MTHHPPPGAQSSHTAGLIRSRLRNGIDMPTQTPHHLSLLLFVRIHTALLTKPQRLRLGGDRGQATTEYALVLLAAALVGLMVVAWATAGGGAARISRLFNSVIDAVIDKV